MERGGRVERRIHLGSMGQEHFYTFNTARSTSVTERRAAIYIPGVHLEGRKIVVAPGLLYAGVLLPEFNTHLLILQKTGTSQRRLSPAWLAYSLISLRLTRSFVPRIEQREV